MLQAYFVKTENKYQFRFKHLVKKKHRKVWILYHGNPAEEELPEKSFFHRTDAGKIPATREVQHAGTGFLLFFSDIVYLQAMDVLWKPYEHESDGFVRYPA